MLAVADAVRTSLGPRGMDKMIQTGSGEVVITNDGATILKHMSVMHPAARMVRSPFLSLHLIVLEKRKCNLTKSNISFCFFL